MPNGSSKDKSIYVQYSYYQCRLDISAAVYCNSSLHTIDSTRNKRFEMKESLRVMTLANGQSASDSKWDSELHQGGASWLKFVGLAYLPHMGDFVEPPPNPNSKTLVFFSFFQFRWANHYFRYGQPDPNAHPDPPTPAVRVVPIHG